VELDDWDRRSDLVAAQAHWLCPDGGVGFLPVGSSRKTEAGHENLWGTRGSRRRLPERHLAVDSPRRRAGPRGALGTPRHPSASVPGEAACVWLVCRPLLQVIADYTRLGAVLGRPGHRRASGPQYPGVTTGCGDTGLPVSCLFRTGGWVLSPDAVVWSAMGRPRVVRDSPTRPLRSRAAGTARLGS
jgi:hypothetical protein